MTSEVEICNLALAHLRAKSINSLTESSVEAQYCKLHFPFLRDQMLEDTPWQFAHKIAPLAVLSDTLFNWAFVYQYPADCLHINKLLPNYTSISPSGISSPTAARLYDHGHPQPDLTIKIPYQIYNVDNGRVIASNDGELRADYRSRVTNPNLFSSQFVMALSYLLAAELAIPIVGVEKGRALRGDNLSIYEQYLGAAIASDGNEQHRPVNDSEFITIRG